MATKSMLSAKITRDTPRCEAVQCSGGWWTTQYLTTGEHGRAIINWYGNFDTREEAETYIARVWRGRAGEKPFLSGYDEGMRLPTE